MLFILAYFIRATIIVNNNIRSRQNCIRNEHSNEIKQPELYSPVGRASMIPKKCILLECPSSTFVRNIGIGTTCAIDQTIPLGILEIFHYISRIINSIRYLFISKQLYPRKIIATRIISSTDKTFDS